MKLLSGPTGPYDHGYLMCRVKYLSGQIKMVTYHKYLYEMKHGPVAKGILIHHIDEDKSNNDLSNLEAKPIQNHSRDHQPSKQMVRLKCRYCKIMFMREACNENGRLRRGCSGPYCGKSCANLGHRYL